MNTVIFVALAQGGQDSGYTARLVDFPDAMASGESMAGLLAAAREALLQQLQARSDDGLDWPAATPLEQVAIPPGAIPFLVDVAVDDTPMRVNISIGERLLKRIDQAAEAQGMSRSAFISSAARSALGDRSTRPSGVADFDAVSRRLQDEWSELNRRIQEGLGPDSAFSRKLTELDNRAMDTLRKTADSISEAIARRRASEAGSRNAEAPTETRTDETVG